MDYNTKRKKMALPEYGRNIQNMVDYLLTIEDREKRNRSAQTVIDVMGNLFPHLRDVQEFKHKLWDHLAIMSDFNLDIDYPYDPPSPESLNERPNTVPYSKNRIKYKHYGKTMELLIQEADNFEGEEREIIIEQLANHMKKSYLAWNKDAVEDQMIFNDLEEMSRGHLKVPEGTQLADAKTLVGPSNKKKKTKKKK
ncbi:DUF4290 domain-containing protein [uncultured Draconibacterium sp.]|uniref:DUF4290 domain-containing protein n=1 Tax=uncultured Draconibacterium sp. TaxID=1573823 RepID=UPI0029C09ED0|nr:DUF4290 domain-containing protein [uncultured Draconibacterium sp.]|eukprot:Anaeramoba_flamelloidesc36922_g1_i2.p1 GENE.c36922_g1_i2~~c36922_g1_i2.p1  ORF type:complete len:196 (-),score=26.91 c36922_g1_i2:98-685(-)